VIMAEITLKILRATYNLSFYFKDISLMSDASTASTTVIDYVVFVFMCRYTDVFFLTRHLGSFVWTQQL